MADIDELFRASPVARALLDFDTHRVASVNPAWERMFGYSLEEARGRDGAVLRTWADEADRNAFVGRIESQRQLGWQVSRRLRRNGEAFEALTSAEEFLHEGRRFHLTTIVDISAQARAAEASAHLAAMFQASPVAHSLVDVERGVFHDVNPACERMFGHPREGFIGRTGREVGFWPDEDEYGRFVDAVREGDGSLGYAGRRRRANGEIFDVRVYWEQVAIGGRKYRLYSLLDITAEVAGKRSMEQLSRFFRSSPTAHLISRLDDGRYVEVNEAYERMFGFRRDEVIGRTTLERGVKFEPGVRSAYAERIRREGRVVNQRIRTIRKDGSPIEVLFSAETIELEGVGCLLVSMADMTGEVRAKAAEERLARFFRSSPLPHGITRHADGVFVDVNDAHERLTGYTREELIGRSALEVGIWRDPAQREHFVRAMVDGRVVDFAARVRRKNGEVFDALLSGELTDLEGVPHLLWSLVDATAMVASRDALEQRVRERTAELSAANEELAAFSYSVSHDMRSPVRAIIGFAAILRAEHGDGLSPEARRLVERVASEADRMGELIDAMLELSRLMRRPLERQEVDLSALARKLIDELRERDPAREVEAKVQPGLTAFVDPVLFRSVLGNLIDNAWKYTSRMPRASIAFGRDAGRFFLRDNGAGFDMAYVGKLFKPFERLHGTDEFPGTGIGLATVERILRRHGGNVVAEGAPGAGATIYFSLPG